MNTKTVIVTGGNNLTNYESFCETMKLSPWYGGIDTVFTGNGKGIDEMVHRWCEENGITYQIFRIEWDIHGRAAGPLRNQEMVLQGAEAIIVHWDGVRINGKNIFSLARRHKVPIFQRVVQE